MDFLRKKSLWVSMSVLLMQGCDGGAFGEMSNSELQSRFSECKAAGNSMAPGTAITCGNIERECSRRADSLGRRVCF